MDDGAVDERMSVCINSQEMLKAGETVELLDRGLR